ncbi:glycosyltransferase family 4 protein [Azospirillum sp.]|uniref:glycosyltransferase family 4 protein n=1 Tax=Azospirillum sp. TaxID=34012 RepID=UPI002D649732|nr:glycosyltransferase family 4 protein [Azospirillum sp.]HYD70520.1 glycosyltransferase family 4 protein [Azospirillum sp.]
MKLVIEGWRHTLHSFCVVNHFHLLELARRPDILVHHRDRPYYGASWRPMAGLFSTAEEAILNAVHPPPEGFAADVCLRLAIPYDFSPTDARRLVVFATSDAGQFPADMIVGGRLLAEAHRDSGALIITPSSWSKAGLAAAGADPERVAVVPHGVDTDRFRPADPDYRRRARQVLGWEGKFVFLNVGAMSGNKGIYHIGRTLAALVPEHPDILLFLKGADHTYRSQEGLQESLSVLTPAERARLDGRILYNGGPVPFADMAMLYRAADAYIAPYSAEGFNMPVLEAMACGLPVICTGGGPTDDFLHPEAALRIDSRVQRLPDGGRVLLIDPGHLTALTARAIEDAAWRERAASVGPAWVAERYSWARVVDRLLEACRL